MKLIRLVCLFAGSLAAALLCAAARGQEPIRLPSQAKPIVLPKPVPDVKPVPVWQPLSYGAGAQRAVDANRPLVTFVGCQARLLAGVVVASCQALDGYDAPSIVVSVPGSGWLEWKATLSATASDAQIAESWQAKAVQPVAAPFERANAERDDSDLGRGPWPASIDFPAGMVRYRRSRFTQEIAVTNGQDRITPVPRTVLDRHWHQSGGMEGIPFRSDVYKDENIKPRIWVGDIQVLNSFGHFQPNRGWKREYPPGARFMDVLSNRDSGEVFEVRKLEKDKAGQWYIFVDYENADARPAGYTGKLTRSCSSCHSEAGSGAYAAGLVIGGEFVLSDPFPELEAGR